MSALTPRDVAYVAIQVRSFVFITIVANVVIFQVRFTLSWVQTWAMTDGDFNYSDFYWNVVDSLSGEEGAEIIQRLNL